MAFKPLQMQYYTGIRGVAGYMVYSDSADDITGTIDQADYFTHIEVMGFIKKQREGVTRGVPILVYGKDKFEGSILSLLGSETSVTYGVGGYTLT